jgi:ABC-type Fe3+-siderophore transport system permease subunit
VRLFTAVVSMQDCCKNPLVNTFMLGLLSTLQNVLVDAVAWVQQVLYTSSLAACLTQLTSLLAICIEVMFADIRKSA